MAIQLSVACRNGRLDAIETEFGASPKLKIRTLSQPADCAAADVGTVLATFDLPSDAMAAAASGSKAKSGTWQETAADGTGTAGHFRLYKTDGTTCVLQGSVGAGSGDLSLDSVSITTGQQVTVNTFTITDGNA
jgi:hypothetical protein